MIGELLNKSGCWLKFCLLRLIYPMLSADDLISFDVSWKPSMPMTLPPLIEISDPVPNNTCTNKSCMFICLYVCVCFSQQRPHQIIFSTWTISRFLGTIPLLTGWKRRHFDDAHCSISAAEIGKFWRQEKLKGLSWHVYAMVDEFGNSDVVQLLAVFTKRKR